MLTAYSFFDVSWNIHVQNNDRFLIVSGQGDTRGVHHLEPFGENIIIGKSIELHGIRIQYRIFIIDTIDFGCL